MAEGAQVMAMTIKSVRDRLASWYGGSEACLDVKACAELGDMIAALDAHLTQPAQTVDVTDDDVEAAGAAYFEQQWDMLPTRSKAIYRNALRRALKSFSTRALSAEKAGCQHDWAIGYGVPAYCNKCGEPMTLLASPTPDKDG
jgi:hypothetical protein